MKFIKNNKLLTICIFVFLCLIITAGIGAYQLLVPESGTSLYGNRLEGIEDVPIGDETSQAIESDIKLNANVTNVKYDLKGKLINVIIDVSDNMDMIVAQALTDKILTNLSDEQKDFYDVQVFIKSDNEESEIYPIIGYKKNTEVKFTWSNN